MACGFLATWRGVPQAAIPGLNAFVLYFALPCMLYRFGAQTPIHQLLDINVTLVYLCCAALMVGATVLLTRKRLGWNDAAFGALVAAFPNTGFMGVPMLAACWARKARAGDRDHGHRHGCHHLGLHCAVAPGSGGRAGHLAGGAQLAQGMASNPMPWAILLGGLASAMGWVLPGLVDKTVAMLAGAASPVALFTIGAVLARSQMNSHERVAAVDYVPIALAKLIIHPLLVWAAGMAAIELGMPLQHDTLVVLVLLAALPSASNVSLLTERYGAQRPRGPHHSGLDQSGFPELLRRRGIDELIK